MKQKDESVQVIDYVGSPILTVKPEVTRNSTGRSQLVSLVKSIMETAKEQGVSPKACGFRCCRMRFLRRRNRSFRRVL